MRGFLPDRQIRHRACALKDTVHAIIRDELDEDFEKICEEIKVSRRTRGKCCVTVHLHIYMYTYKWKGQVSVSSEAQTTNLSDFMCDFSFKLLISTDDFSTDDTDGCPGTDFVSWRNQKTFFMHLLTISKGHFVEISSVLAEIGILAIVSKQPVLWFGDVCFNFSPWSYFGELKSSVIWNEPAALSTRCSISKRIFCS